MADQFFIFFSQLLDMSVLDADGRVVGHVYDLSLDLNNDIYPRARGIIIKRGLFPRTFAEVAMTEVARTNGRIQLRQPISAVKFQKEKIDCEFALRRDVLDQQIVDVENKKVVRVNDVHLLRVDNQLHIAHVDVGLRALVRRLGWQPGVDDCVRLFRPKSTYLTHEEFISWKNSQVLTIGSQKNVLKLDVARAKIAKIPPTVLAEIMGDLDVFEQVALFRSLAPEVQRGMFADMAMDDKAGLIDQLEDVEAVQIISSIPSDEAADLLMTISKVRMHQLLRLMENQTSKKLRMLLGFRKDSAGGLMTTEYLWLLKTATVADAMNKVKASTDFHGNIMTIYVVDENHRYLGTTTIRRFINEDPARLVIETCHSQKVFVRTDDGMEEVALLLEQYKHWAIPVLDGSNVLVGTITVDDVMEELISLAWGKYKDQL